MLSRKSPEATADSFAFTVLPAESRVAIVRQTFPRVSLSTEGKARQARAFLLFDDELPAARLAGVGISMAEAAGEPRAQTARATDSRPMRRLDMLCDLVPLHLVSRRGVVHADENNQRAAFDCEAALLCTSRLSPVIANGLPAD